MCALRPVGRLLQLSLLLQSSQVSPLHVPSPPRHCPAPVLPPPEWRGSGGPAAGAQPPGPVLSSHGHFPGLTTSPTYRPPCERFGVELQSCAAHLLGSVTKLVGRLGGEGEGHPALPVTLFLIQAPAVQTHRDPGGLPRTGPPWDSRSSQSLPKAQLHAAPWTSSPWQI